MKHNLERLTLAVLVCTAASLAFAEPVEFSHETYAGRIMVVGDSIFATGPGGGRQWELLKRYYPNATVDCCAANGMRGSSVYERHFSKRSDDDLRKTDAIVFRIGINDNHFGSAFEKGYAASNVQDRVAFTDALPHLSGSAAGYVVRMASRARTQNPRVKLFLEPYMVYVDHEKEEERHINADMRKLADAGLGFVYVDGHPYGGDSLNNACLPVYQIDSIHHAALRHEFEGDWLARWLEPRLAEGARVRRSEPNGHRVLLVGDATEAMARLSSAYPNVTFENLPAAADALFAAVTNLADETVRDLDLAVIRTGKGVVAFGDVARAMPQKCWRYAQCFPRNVSGIDLDARFGARGVAGFGRIEVRSVGPEAVVTPPANTLRGIKGIRSSLARTLNMGMSPAARRFVPGCVARMNAMSDSELRAELTPGFLHVQNGVTNEITTLDQYWAVFDDTPCGAVARTLFYLRWKNPRIKIVLLAYPGEEAANEGLAALAERKAFNWPLVRDTQLVDELYLQLMSRTAHAANTAPKPPDRRKLLRLPVTGTLVVKYDGKDHKPVFEPNVAYSVDYSADAFVEPGSYDVTFTLNRPDMVRWDCDAEGAEYVYKCVIEE